MRRPDVSPITDHAHRGGLRQYVLYFGIMGMHLPYFNLYCYHLGFSGMEIGVLSALRSLAMVVFPIAWSAARRPHPQPAPDLHPVHLRQRRDLVAVSLHRDLPGHGG